MLDSCKDKRAYCCTAAGLGCTTQMPLEGQMFDCTEGVSHRVQHRCNVEPGVHLGFVGFRGCCKVSGGYERCNAHAVIRFCTVASKLYFTFVRRLCQLARVAG